MGTQYKLIENDDYEITLDEMSAKYDLTICPKTDGALEDMEGLLRAYGTAEARKLTAKEAEDLAIKILKVLSYVDEDLQDRAKERIGDLWDQ